MRASLARVLLVVVWLYFRPTSGIRAAGPPIFEAAYYGHNVFYVFPADGKEFSIQLPVGVPVTANLIGFASNGRSAYLQVPSAAVLHLSDELIQVEFSSLHLAPVRGSGGLGEIISVTSSPSGDLLVAAAYGPEGLCAAYDVDASSGAHRRIRTEPKCASFITQVEPDGMRVLLGDDLNFRVIDAATGSIRFSGVGHAAWSPDGNWLAIWRKGEATVFDGRTFSMRRRFQVPSIDGHFVWSPDAKRILFAQKERECQDDFESLSILNVETGNESVIPSSHCAVTNSRIGWVEASSLPTHPTR